MRLLLCLLAPLMGRAALISYTSNEPRGAISAPENNPCMNDPDCYALIKTAIADTLALGDYLPTPSPVSDPTPAPTPAPKGNGNKGGNKMLRGRRELGQSCDACFLEHGLEAYWICVVVLNCESNRRDLLSYSLAGATEEESQAVIADSCWVDNVSLTPAFHDAVMAKLPANDPEFDGVTIKLQQYHSNCDLVF